MRGPPSITTEAQKALEDKNTEYILTVPSDGSCATLTAGPTLGLWGLPTVGELWYHYHYDGINTAGLRRTKSHMLTL